MLKLCYIGGSNNPRKENPHKPTRIYRNARGIKRTQFSCSSNTEHPPCQGLDLRGFDRIFVKSFLKQYAKM